MNEGSFKTKKTPNRSMGNCCWYCINWCVYDNWEYSGFADDTQTYPIEASGSNKFNLTDSPSLLSSENLGTNNREQEVATLSTTGQVDSSTETTPEHMMSESSTVSLGTSDVATSETSTSVLASLSEVVPTKSTDRSEALVPSTLSEAPNNASSSEGGVSEVKSQSETLVEHSTNRKMRRKVVIINLRYTQSRSDNN